MGNYIKKKPSNPSFSQKGFDGYNYEINNSEISITYEDVFEGHDKYCTNTKSTHFYYVISGSGKFKISEEIHDVEEGDVVEIPANTAFVFSGKMRLLLIMNPCFVPENDIVGKENDLY